MEKECIKLFHNRIGIKKKVKNIERKNEMAIQYIYTMAILGTKVQNVPKKKKIEIWKRKITKILIPSTNFEIIAFGKCD